jgi:hypothetical protein
MLNEIKITASKNEFTAIGMYVSGVFMKCDQPCNGRIYPRSLIEREIKLLISTCSIPKGFFGSENQVGPGAVSKADGPLKEDGVRFPHDPSVLV